MLNQEAQQQYLKEKGQIDDIIDKILLEDKHALNDKMKKRQLCQEAMVMSKQEKLDKIEKEKARERYENEIYMAFIKEKEFLANQIKEKKETESAAKEAVFKKLFLEEEKRRIEQEELENLKNELYVA